MLKCYISKCDEIGLEKSVITHFKDRETSVTSPRCSPIRAHNTLCRGMRWRSPNSWQLHVQPPVILTTTAMGGRAPHAGVRDPLNGCGVLSAAPCALFYLTEQLEGEAAAAPGQRGRGEGGKQRLPLDNGWGGRGAFSSLLFSLCGTESSWQPPRGSGLGT